MTTINPSAVEATAEKPWHAAYPAPKTTAPAITRETLLSWLVEGKQAGKDFVLVDLRRTDYEVCPTLLVSCHLQSLKTEQFKLHKMKS